MIIGHQKQWRLLKKLAELGKLPHGILFSGEAQLGKKTLAIEFVKFLNCSSKDLKNKPCQNCRNCRAIQKRLHPDFILIEPASLKGEIQISQVRELIQKLSFRSYLSPFKIAVIDQAHLMNKDAQSCFLKLLEEPRGRTILILISEYPEILLPTIISRVQKIRFFPIAKEEIKKHLVSQGLAQEEAEYLASLSFKKPGIGINFFLNSQDLENQKKLISDLVKIGRSDLSSRFKYIQDLLKKNPDTAQYIIKEALNHWLRYFRTILLNRINCSNLEKSEEFKQYSLSRLSKIISLIESTNFLISTTNANLRLTLEILLIEL